MDTSFNSTQYNQHGQHLSHLYQNDTSHTYFTQNKLRGRKRTMHRSTSRASKQRRDLINTEIARLRELLPLPATVKTRLSYLHVMSLACVYIRKGNFFYQQDTEYQQLDAVWSTEQRFDFTQALHGFLIVMTSNGKLLYMSENVTDYLGHSMVELLSTGGGIYDVIDSRDHAVVRSHLEFNNASGGVERTIFCRMNTSRNMRRRNHCADNKMVHIQGRFLTPNPAGVYPWSYESVFVGLCTPVDVVMPVPNEMAIYNTNIFVTLHGPDMTIKDSEESVLFHLGYKSDEFEGSSWYSLIHNDDLQNAVDFHQRVLTTEGNVTARCFVVLRLLCSNCIDFVAVCITGWIEKEPSSASSSTGISTPSIVCLNQVIRNDEMHAYQSMQNLFESTPKQSSTPTSPKPDVSTTKQDCIECNDLQLTSQNDEASISSWERDSRRCYECYDTNVYNIMQDHADEGGQSSYEFAWNDDGARHNLNSSFHGVISDEQNYNFTSDLENTYAKDLNVVDGVVLNTYPCFSNPNDNNGLMEHPVALYLPEKSAPEQLHDFPNLRRLLKEIDVKRLKIKDEHPEKQLLSSEMKDDVNRDDGGYKLIPCALSSCAYRDTSIGDDKLFVNQTNPVTQSSSVRCTTDYQIEVTSNVVARVNPRINNSESCITSCAVKLLPDPMVRPLHQIYDADNGDIYEALTTSLSKQTSLFDISNGKQRNDQGDEAATVGDSLRHAVRQAIGMLSSDQLHLLDEAICSMIPGSPRVKIKRF